MKESSRTSTRQRVDPLQSGNFAAIRAGELDGQDVGLWLTILTETGLTVVKLTEVHHHHNAAKFSMVHINPQSLDLRIPSSTSVYLSLKQPKITTHGIWIEK